MLCRDCGEIKTQEDFYITQRTRRCKKCHNRRSNSIAKLTGTRAKRRQKALKFLGGVCVHCGYSDERALQIDHINGGGTREAKQLGPAGIIAKVLRGSPGYQLLCANCNQIKKVVNNELPYRTVA